MVERVICNDDVRGSNPRGGTNLKDYIMYTWTLLIFMTHTAQTIEFDTHLKCDEAKKAINRLYKSHVTQQPRVVCVYTKGPEPGHD